jgi:hypothetical protein
MTAADPARCVPPGSARASPRSSATSCLYIKRLEDIDLDVLAEIIQAGLADLGTRWPVDAG